MKMRWRERARRLRTELYALALAARHPRTPWYAKLAVAGLVVYAVTPVDFVPDVVPVLSLVDDLIFVPLAIAASWPASGLCSPRSASLSQYKTRHETVTLAR
jgi:uncharacterized membrane protein YkvA (DUF1232 family)